MADATSQGYGLGKWVVAGLVLAIVMVGLALAGTQPVRAPAQAANAILVANKEKPGVTTTASGLQAGGAAGGPAASFPRACRAADRWRRGPVSPFRAGRNSEDCPWA